jgi:hypothetical protein
MINMLTGKVKSGLQILVTQVKALKMAADQHILTDPLPANVCQAAHFDLQRLTC